MPTTDEERAALNENKKNLATEVLDVENKSWLMSTRVRINENYLRYGFKVYLNVCYYVSLSVCLSVCPFVFLFVFILVPRYLCLMFWVKLKQNNFC